ncbi:epoxide hydrolase [Saccharothrix sp.]|uniref:epoxide hydrolase family protein n=1 Tax=Saccharothrix sp. TaxID=1873460 RepID=UPI0028127891|nr:epoxide hydrolase [Saccharothrix sp.]
MIEPFKLDVPQADLDDLMDRLARTRWPDELPDAGTDFGIPLARVQALVERWKSFDWRAVEAKLNAHPQFTTTIDGQNVHFLHIRSDRDDALPLLITHGWPSSVLDFLDVIEPLRRDFHLVIPSIPGFGPSGPTRERGWSMQRVGRAWAELMDRLGYDRYGTQGGDFGSGISQAVAVAAPDKVVGVHVNYLPTPPPADTEGLSATDLERVEAIKRFLAQRPGYQVMHMTKPQVVAYGITDSPVGLLGWVADKFDEWLDPRSNVSDDRLLEVVTLYWLTGTTGSALRIAKETPPGVPRCPAPLGVAVFPEDIILAVRGVIERQQDVRRWTEFDRGGHFPAIEVPNLLAEDIRAFFADLR